VSSGNPAPHASPECIAAEIHEQSRWANRTERSTHSLLNAWHADQNWTGTTFIEDGMDLLQACHAEPGSASSISNSVVGSAIAFSRIAKSVKTSRLRRFERGDLTASVVVEVRRSVRLIADP
jgi:hypothetical protein